MVCIEETEEEGSGKVSFLGVSQGLPGAGREGWKGRKKDG